MKGTGFDPKGRFWFNGKRFPEEDLQFITVKRSSDGCTWTERIPVTLQQREKLAEEYYNSQKLNRSESVQ